MKINQPTIFIITINYNQSEITLQCIFSLIKSTFKEIEIYLIDNGSDEKDYFNLRNNLPIDSRITVGRIDNNIGYVGAINYGLSKAKKFNIPYILILNNDTIIDEMAVLGLVKACKGFNDQAIVTGKVFDFNEPKIIQDVGRKLINEKLLRFQRIGNGEYDNGQFDKMEERDMIDDVFWLFPLKLLNIIEGYSSYFWFNGEQADFALRAKKIGYKLVYNPEAMLWHKGSVSVGGRIKNPKQAYWSTQSSLILRYLHLSSGYFIYYYFKTTISVFRTITKSFLLFLFKKENQFTYARAKFYGWMYFNKWMIKKNNNVGFYPLTKK